jgi:nitrogen fixation protein NifB
MNTKRPGENPILARHPCFNELAHAQVGRVHLPVALRCNIQCAFCERRVCANLTMQHPGWAREVLSVDEALARVEGLVAERPGEPFVVGVAGPGEPLANEATLEALAAVHDAFPHLMTCLSSNGLLLEDRLPQLVEAGVVAVTVTMNAADPSVAERVYLWARYRGRTYRGAEAAALLVERQFAGVRAALAAGLAVKVNTVAIPGINLGDDGPGHVVELAARLRELGVPLMNLMPLIPAGRLRDHRPPTCDELRAARVACETLVPQFRLCEHCRADIVHFPGISPRDSL